MKLKCYDCGKPIEWKMNWIRELKELFQRPRPKKVCWKCYEDFPKKVIENERKKEEK